MVHHRRIMSLVAGSIVAVGLLVGGGCSSSGGGAGGGAVEGAVGGGAGGFHFPRPSLYAARAMLPTLSGPATTDDSVRVEFLAANATGAPLWLRRMSIVLSAGSGELAAGYWEGDRQIDPGTSLLLDVSLPMVEGAGGGGGLVGVDASEGRLTVKARYARSGLLGLMGGESYTYTLPVVFLPASASEDARP